MRRRFALKVALALCASLAERPVLAAGPATAPPHPAPLRAAPIDRISPPNKPRGVKVADSPVRQVIVE